MITDSEEGLGRLQVEAGCTQPVGGTVSVAQCKDLFEAGWGTVDEHAVCSVALVSVSDGSGCGIVAAIHPCSSGCRTGDGYDRDHSSISNVLLPFCLVRYWRG